LFTLEMMAAEQHHNQNDYQDSAYPDAPVAIAGPAATIAVADATAEKDDGQNISTMSSIRGVLMVSNDNSVSWASFRAQRNQFPRTMRKLRLAAGRVMAIKASAITSRE
jgi:beta-glucanase (GH16 family)